MTKCLIAVGSNLGDRHDNISKAVEQLERLSSTRLLRSSGLLETPPAGQATRPFLNGCLLAETREPPERLIRDLLDIELAGGRTRRPADSGDRSIDLDILLYGDLISNSDLITVPHPRMSFRRFVLEPAAEIAGTLSHPLLGCCITRLLEAINRPGKLVCVCDPGTDSKHGFSPPRPSEQLSPDDSWTIQWLSPACPPDPLPNMNLLIESAPPASHAAELCLAEYRGPRWQTGLTDPAGFFEKLPSLIGEAIESMEPLPCD